MKSYMDTGPFLAVQKAGAAALDQAEAIVAPIRAELEGRRDAAVAALREAGFALEAPKAAMYLWVALPAGHHVGRVCQAGAWRQPARWCCRAAPSVRRAKASSASLSRSGRTDCAIAAARLGQTLQELQRGELAPAT